MPVSPGRESAIQPSTFHRNGHASTGGSSGVRAGSHLLALGHAVVLLASASEVGPKQDGLLRKPRRRTQLEMVRRLGKNYVPFGDATDARNIS